MRILSAQANGTGSRITHMKHNADLTLASMCDSVQCDETLERARVGGIYLQGVSMRA